MCRRTGKKHVSRDQIPFGEMSNEYNRLRLAVNPGQCGTKRPNAAAVCAQKGKTFCNVAIDRAIL